MRRLLTTAVCLVSCVLLALAPLASPALAEDSAHFKIDSVDSAAPGSTFTVALSITGTYNIHVINMAVTFDPAALELTNVENGSVLSGAIDNKSAFTVLEYKDIAKDGFIKLGVAMPTDALTENGELFKMTFKVLDGVKVNQQIFINIYELAYMPIGAEESTPIRFETENAVIKVEGASDPEGGFIEGTSGTPNPAITQVPTVNDNTSEQKTQAPDNGGWNSSGTAVPGSTDSAAGTESTEAPNATRMPGAESAPDGSGGSNGPSTLVYVLIAVAAAAAAAIIAITVKKKKSGGEEE